MKTKNRLDLLLLILVLFVVNIPLLTGATPIAWDTFKSPFQEFAITYNSIFYDHELPFWLPNSIYGIPDYFWLAAQSIVSFLFIGIGNILRIENVLLLFKISLFCEQLIAVFGMFLLSKRLFKKRLTILITCFAFIVTFSVYRQVQLNFRLIYLLPLILYWITLFFQEKTSLYVWLAGITMILAVPGSAYYPLIIEFYSIAIFSLVLFIADPSSIKGLFKFSRKDVFGLILLVILSVLFVYYFRTFNDGISIMRDGRNASGSVTANDFLTWWKTWNPFTLLFSFLYGFVSKEISNDFEYIFYIGLVPLIGIIAALRHNRKIQFLAFLLPALFLFAFSQRSIFTLVSYYLPFINMTRYVAILGTIPLQTYLIIIAGFGLDMELTVSQWKKLCFSIIGLLLVIDVFGMNTTNNESFLEILKNPGLYSSDIYLFLVRIVIYGLFCIFILYFSPERKPFFTQLNYSRFVRTGLLLAVIIDLGLFRFNYDSKINDFLTPSRSFIDQLPDLQPIEFSNSRLMDPVDLETQQALSASMSLQLINAWSVESFIQFDRCIPSSVLQSGDYEVFNSSLSSYINSDIIPKSADDLSIPVSQIFGCGYPKLRLVTNVMVNQSNNEVIEEIKQASDLSNLLILNSKYTDIVSSSGNPAVNADIEIVDFSTNRLELEVTSPQDGVWLVYSDLYHPDWQATINGEPVKIERAYLAFKAIPLLKGSNYIVFVYGSSLKRIAYTTLAILFGALAFTMLISILAFLLPEVAWIEKLKDRLFRKKT